MTHDQAITLIRRHGWEPNICTVGGLKHIPVHQPNPMPSTPVCSTFYTELGHQDQYKLADVQNWLGY